MYQSLSDIECFPFRLRLRNTNKSLIYFPKDYIIVVFVQGLFASRVYFIHSYTSRLQSIEEFVTATTTVDFTKPFTSQSEYASFVSDLTCSFEQLDSSFRLII